MYTVSLGLSDVFSWSDCCCALSGRIPQGDAPFSHPTEGVWYWCDLLLVLLAVITWLRWNLPGFSTVKVLYPLLKLYFGGVAVRLYKYPVLYKLVPANFHTHWCLLPLCSDGDFLFPLFLLNLLVGVFLYRRFVPSLPLLI